MQPFQRTALLAFVMLMGMTCFTGASARTGAVKPAAAAAALSTAAANKKIVLDFYEQFFNQHDLSAASRYIGDTYIQHNPGVPNGREAFVKVFAQVFAKFPQRHSEISQAIAEGNLVAVHVHTVSAPGERGSAIVDIFRLDQGKIVEHWDVIQAVPEKSANENTMF